MAGALILELLAVGTNRFLKTLAVAPRYIYTAGLTLAFATGIGPLLLGYPFLTSYIFKSIHFSTASLFDFGVFFTVVGVTIEIIVRLEETEESEVAA